MNLDISKDIKDLSSIKYASQGNAILGIRDSGKSYTAMKIAEELLTAGIPIIAFDPVGIWKFLRVGVGGYKGFPVVVVGGDSPDIPLNIQTLQTVIRSAMKENVSLVIDLYSLEHANKSTWIKIVQESIRILLYENKKFGLRHIFLEEAAEFIPQKIEPQHRVVYAELERLARVGRNSKLGYTIINQRAEEVNKAILEISDFVLLHLQVGKNSLLSLKKWFDVMQFEKKRVETILNGLTALKQGECFAVSRGNVKMIKIEKKKTFHPNPSEAETKPMPKLGEDVSRFIASMTAAAVKETKQPANIDALVSLREENTLLKADNQRLRGDLMKMRVSIKDAAGLIVQKITPVLRDQVEQILHALPPIGDETISAVSLSQMADKKIADTQKRIEQKLNNHLTSALSIDNSLGKCERAILSVLAQRAGIGTNKAQVSILSGYSISSSGFANSLSSLRTKKYITGSGDLFITDEGIKAVGSYEPMPKGNALMEYWYSKLGKAESSILKVIIAHFPKHLSKKEISDLSGYSVTSSGFANALSSLRTLQLIEGYSSMVAAEIFWQ